MNEASFEYEERGQAGMTLLDHFAGLAMQGIIKDYCVEANDSIQNTVAKMSYEMAAAMLKEREKWV